MTQSERPRNTEPPRLGSVETGDPVLDELGRWFAQTAPPPGVDASMLARVEARLRGVGEPRRAPSLRTVAAGFALFTVATGSAAMWRTFAPARWASPFARSPAAATAPDHEHAARPQPPRHAAPTPASSAANDSVPTPNDSATAPKGSVPTPNDSATAPDDSVPQPPPIETRPHAADLVPPAASASPAAPSALARESAALERALTALRREHDAPRALVLLERYAAEFPAGVLRLEADVTRIDAELAVGDEPAALALLERVPLERVGRGLELRLVRAELLAKRDCRSALLDFDRVLAEHPGRGFDERALYGRATCRASLGNAAGANADFSAYLARYPDGRFAELVRSRTR